MSAIIGREKEIAELKELYNGDKRSNKVKGFFGVIKETLLYPFKKDLVYFLILWILIALPNCYSQRNSIGYAVCLAMMYYIMAYVADVVLNLFHWVAKVLKPIVIVLATLVATLNLYCYIVYDCLLSNDFIQIIGATNPNEAKEYFDTFITWRHIVVLILVLAMSIFIAVMIPKMQKLKLGKSWIIASGMLLVSVAVICLKLGIIKEEFADKERWNLNFEEVVALRNHLTHPQLTESDSIHTSHIVIILGESFSSNHSSLYGYGKNTNPLLAEQARKGNLFVFKNVKSPCTHTTKAFKYLLNTYQIGQESEHPWYESTNLIEAMKNAGYYTAWISNQSEKGMFDNIPSGHARLCDESFFLENETDTKRLDGKLIGKASAKTQNKSMVFYHLLGQHINFQERYPREYDNFKGTDYTTYAEHQRDVLAYYDNATLYNDFVVNAIMDLYKEQDAVVFYFSDHALDIFDTDPDYFGHARQTEASQKQGRIIPFIVYVSPLFQELHSEKVERIKASVNKPFCTDKFIYAVMDVTGYRFANNDDVQKFSLFN